MKTVHRKARAGRPPTGRDLPETTRMPATLMAEVKPGRPPMTLPAPPLSAGYWNWG